MTTAVWGIDLLATAGSEDPVTPNDPGNPDVGANLLQNFPVITSAVVTGAGSTIGGSLNSSSNTTFTVEFFASSVCDPSGCGEGERFLGTTSLTTDGSGNGAFSATVPGIIPNGWVVAATATDPLENTSEFSACFNTPDTTPPVIAHHDDVTAEATGADGAVVTYTSPGTTDNVDPPGTATCSPGSGSRFALGDTTVTCNASDAAGNDATPTSFAVHVVDTTAPTITFVSALPAPNAAGWNKSDVTLRWSCSDAVGVLASEVTKVIAAEGSGLSETGTCEDTTGNAASNTHDDVNLDKTPPTPTWIGGPAAGGTYIYGSVPAAPTCTAADGLSGANGCTVSGYGSEVGAHIMTATAEDVAGNEATETRSYTVASWTLKGFYQPVDMSTPETMLWNTVKGGSTVPFKFEVFSGSTELTDPAVVDAFKTDRVTCPNGNATTDQIEVTVPGETSLRYDATAGQFVYNWQTPKKGACYLMTMTTDDGSTLRARFILK